MRLVMARVGWWAMILSFTACGFALGGIVWSMGAMFFIGAFLYGGAFLWQYLENERS